MKPDESRIPLRHEHEHAVPTVIHDPEADLPLLGRWLRHAMDNPLRFWGGVGALTALLVAVSLLAGGLKLGKASADEAWAKLETAKTPAERVEIAREFPKTQAERWALLQAATEYYNQGFNDLPSNRDAALPTLKKALDTFDKVASESPEDSPQARAAALGMARTLEARNELEKALKQYEKVANAKAWAGTPEAREAARLAAVLKKPEAAAFYKELYAYKPPEAVLPPGGTGALNIPVPPLGNAGSSPLTIPELFGKAAGQGTAASPIVLPDLSNLPPPPPTAAGPKIEAPPAKTVDLTPSTAPKAEAPKAKNGDLPADVFTPGKGDDAAKKKYPVDPMSPPELSDVPTEFTVKARMGGKRVDAYLSSRYPDYSRSVMQKVIDARAVLINGQPVKPSYKVREGDVIRLWLPELSDDASAPEDIPLELVYEDPAFTVVNKPAGMVTHPAKGHWSGTLVNALQFHFDTLSTVAGENRPGIVHRLDRDTTGLILVAKDDHAHRVLAAQFEQRTIHKEYLAIVSGAPSRDSDYIEKAIGFHPTNREKMAIRTLQDGAKEAVTFYEVVERFRGHALVRCQPRTGRTHQIRVHLAHIGHPILADKAYSGRDRFTFGDLLGVSVANADEVLIERQALHAHALSLTHPLTGESLAFTAPLPADMARTLSAIREHRG